MSVLHLGGFTPHTVLRPDLDSGSEVSMAFNSAGYPVRMVNGQYVNGGQVRYLLKGHFRCLISSRIMIGAFR